MTTIAHLSDLHLLEEGHQRRTGLARLRLAYLTFGRPADAEGRKRRAVQALRHARRAGADHVVLTGDLTEDGLDAQFEVLAEVLAESRIDPSRTTLIPGNHDAYVDPHAFARALSGPLKAFAPTSVPGSAIRLPGAVLVALSSAIHQAPTRSSGSVDAREIDVAKTHAEATRASGDALVIAVHHPPRPHVLPPMQWIDGLTNHAQLMRLLLDYDHAHVVHGHTHFRTDDAVRSGGKPRIFSTEAVVTSDAPVRLYSARHGRFTPLLEPSVAGLPNLVASF